MDKQYALAKLYGIDLMCDRRVKVGNFVPDKKTGKFYRIHPDTRKLIDAAINRENNRSLRDTLIWREMYKPMVLHSPLIGVL